jgi:hypothetical protein
MPLTQVTILSPDFPTWNNIPNGNQGSGWQMRPSYRTAWFTATGTFGADGSVQLEGSNDGANWFKLSPAALTAAGSFAALGVTEVPKYIRPNVTAGDGTTSITVIGSALDND